MKTLLPTLLIATLILPFTARATDWNAGRDLARNEKPDGGAQETANPNATVPQWSYGYRDSITGTALTLFTPAGHTNSTGGQAGSEGYEMEDAAVAANTTDHPIVYSFCCGPLAPVAPGEMILGVNRTDRNTVVRWTAPAAGTYTYHADWRDIDPNGGDGAAGYIVVNGVQAFGQLWPNGNGSGAATTATVSLNAGDTIDFLLNNGPAVSFDTTRVTFTVATGTTAASGCVAQPAGAVAQYAGEGNADDSVGPNNGAPQNGATFAPGLVGSAFSFDGVDDYVAIPYSPALNPERITLEAWINPRSIKTGSRIISKDSAANSCAAPTTVVYSLEARGQQGNRADFYFTTADNTFHELVGTSVLATGVFSHIAATYDGATARIYVNGVLESSMPASGPLKSSDASTVIGSGGPACRAVAGGQIEFDGLIDEVGVYNRALSDAEIASVYHAGSSGKCAGSATPRHGGLSDVAFQVNESDQPTAVAADSVLRFQSVQNGRAAGLSVRVQSSTDNGTTWKDLTDGANGRMSFVMRSGSYVLNSKNYPTVSNVYFRSVAKGAGYGEKASPPVGPFNLSSTVPRLSGPVFFVASNGPIAPIAFGAKEEALPSGITVRVQSSQTPEREESWEDAPLPNSGRMIQDAGESNRPADPRQFYLSSAAYPAGTDVYFRAVAAASGYADALSFAYGPFTFIEDPPAKIQISLNGVAGSRNDIDSGYVLPTGSFSMRAQVTSNGRSTKKMTLLYDGVTIATLDDTTNIAVNDYRTNIPGDHIVEAYAIDDLGIVGAAPPIHVRVLTAAPGRVFAMVQSGNWNDPANWSVAGDPGVPGANDFAIVGSYSPTLTTDVTVNALSLNGGTLSGAKTLTVTAFGTIAAGNIKSNLTIASGATLEFLNDDNVGLTGRLLYAGTVRMHGKGGITGIKSGSSSSAGGGFMPASDNPDGVFDFVGGIIEGVKTQVSRAANAVGSAAKFIFDHAAGGRGGSSKQDKPTVVTAAQRKVDVVTFKHETPIEVLPLPVAKVVSNDGGSLVTDQGSGVISSDGAGLVAAGAGNLIGNAGGALIGNAGGALVGNAGGTLLATPGSPIVATDPALISQDGSGVVSHDGGGVISSDGAGITTHANSSAAAVHGHAESEPAAFIQNGGETNMSDLTIEGPVILNGGVLSGSGFIFGDLTNNGGYIAPGHSPGAIAVLGNFSQGADGTLVLEDGGPQPTQFDQLHVTGNAALGGKLIVNTINGYMPDAADTFNPLAYSSVSGGFASITGNAQLTFNADGAIATVNPAVPNAPGPKLLNIATRMRVEKGDQALIAGFIITGTAPKKVLMRGIGPSLGNFGVADALQDPTLELNNPDGSSQFNNDWRDTQEAEVNASTIPPSDNREAAIVATLQPGQLYTAVLRGNGDTAGVGAVEVYDLSADADAQLANISTRGFVQTGDNVMIGGFIVAGNSPAKVIVRGIGPSLMQFGVQGALEDPTLDVVDADGNTVASDDDWRNTQEAEIAASGVAPSNDQEAAIVVTLTPGAYTAIVRGKDNTSGIGLVEAYNLH